MKILLIRVLLLLCIGSAVKAQPFEGVIIYQISYQVVEAERTDLEIYKSMIPKEMKIYLKGPSSMLQFAGGLTEGILGDILYKTADKAIYSIFHNTKTFSKTPLSSLNNKEDIGLKALKTDSVKMIQGYECTKYLVRDQAEGTETVLWCARSINNTSSKIMGYFLESMTEISVNGIEGLPLKIDFKGKEFNLLLEAVNKDKKVLDASLFTIPKNYRLSKADNQLY